MATKAVHIEVVSDLTTESFLGALHRFIGRRGLCNSIYCDNATNFVGAKNQFEEFYQFLQTNNNEINAFLLRRQINWHFIPAGSPHMGGLWEASVKLLKTNLFKVAGNHILTLEEFTTLMVRIEAAINSRPLCKDQREDIDVITPAHLVIGRSLVDVPEPAFVNKSSRWHVVKQIYQHFWQKWHTDYVTALQNRCKWRETKENIKVGDVVLLADDQSPSLHWPLARVINVHPGTDGHIRVVTIKVAGAGAVKRPIHKVCRLPV